MRKAIRSKSLAERKRRKIIIFASAGAVFALVLFLLLIWAAYHENFLIKEVEVSGSLKADAGEIEGVARDSLQGYSFLFFPRRNFIFAPVKEISRSIASLDPVIKAAVVQRIGANKLAINVIEREPYVIWCGQGAECFYADNSGVIFLPAPRFSGETYPLYISGLSGDPLGRNFVQAQDLARLESFRVFLEEMGFDLDKIVLKEAGDYEALVESGARIIFDLENIDEEATNIKTLLESEGDVGDGFSFEDLDYIDLRYGNKIFWKPVDSQ